VRHGESRRMVERRTVRRDPSRLGRRTRQDVRAWRSSQRLILGGEGVTEEAEQGGRGAVGNPSVSEDVEGEGVEHLGVIWKSIVKGE